MLGRRQQRIVDTLADGAFSFEALVARLAPDRAEDRRLIQAALVRLQAAGMVQMVGRRGMHGLCGCMVELRTP